MSETFADLIACEDALMFVNAAITSTGQREFHHDPGEQRLSLEFLHAYTLENYREVMAPVDPVRYLDRAAPAHLLFQYGRRDVFPLDGLERFAGAGSQPKTRMVYDAGHFLNEEARSDAVDWLVETLGREAPAILETVRSR